MTDDEAQELQDHLRNRHLAGDCIEQCPWCFPEQDDLDEDCPF